MTNLCMNEGRRHSLAPDYKTHTKAYIVTCLLTTLLYLRHACHAMMLHKSALQIPGLVPVGYYVQWHMRRDIEQSEPWEFWCYLSCFQVGTAQRMGTYKMGQKDQKNKMYIIFVPWWQPHRPVRCGVLIRYTQRWLPGAAPWLRAILFLVLSGQRVHTRLARWGIRRMSHHLSTKYLARPYTGASR